MLRQGPFFTYNVDWSIVRGSIADNGNIVRIGLRRPISLFLEFDQNHPVASLVTVHPDCSRILQYRDRLNPLGSDIVDRGCRLLPAIDQDQRIGTIGGRCTDFQIFFLTFVLRKEIDGFGKGPESQRRERQEQKHAGSGPPRRFFSQHHGNTVFKFTVIEAVGN